MMARRVIVEEGPDPVDIHVGGRVRAQRLLVNMTQTELAEALDLTFQQVQKYEKGTNRISASKLYHIARVLGVDPGFFFEGLPTLNKKKSKEDKTRNEITSVIQAPDAVRMMRNFGQIENPELRRGLLSLTQTIKREWF